MYTIFNCTQEYCIVHLKHILIVAHGISVAHVITYYEYYTYVYIQSTRGPHLARILGPGKITKTLQNVHSFDIIKTQKTTVKSRILTRFF